MRGARPLVRGGCAVASQHLARPPPGQAHEVALRSFLGEPRVGERVAQPMRIEVVDAGLAAAVADEVLDA